VTVLHLNRFAGICRFPCASNGAPWLVLATVLSVAFLLPQKGHAQTQNTDAIDLRPEELKEVHVYSVSMYLQSNREAPASVTVISANQIRKFGYRTVAEILNTVREFYGSYDRTSAALERAIVGKKANGRRIEAMNPRSANEFRLCNVLFIGFTDKGRIVPILHSIAGSGVLAVGQADTFLSLGGMINLLQKDGTGTLEIDPKTTDSAGLKVSSRLLVVALVVNNERAVEGQ